MKTRRILAASTAALLAFGTTAIVASAATSKSGSVAASGTTVSVDCDADTTSVAITVADFAGKTVNKVDAYPTSGMTASEVQAIVDGTATISGGVVTFTGLTDETETLHIKFKTATDATSLGSETDITVTLVWPDEVVVPGDADTFDDDCVFADDLDSDGNCTLYSGGLGKIKSVKVNVSDDDQKKLDDEKYEKYKLYGSIDSFLVDGDKVSIADASNDTIKGLDKTLKNEIKKIKATDFAIVNINAADNDVVKGSTPVPVTITMEVSKNFKVYHVSGKTVEKLKVNSDKLTNDTYRISFTTKTFSPFILTTADLKSANATTATNDPTSTPVTSTSDGTATTNPNTGIALAIAPVVLAAGAVAVVALKKKH